MTIKDTIKMKQYREIENYLSDTRLNPYLDYCKRRKLRALILYQMNLRLSAAFSPILSLLEVALRNSIDKNMTINYPISNEKNWINQLRFDITVAERANVIHKADFHQLKSKIIKAKSSINKKVENDITNYLKRKHRKNTTFKQKSYVEQERFINSQVQQIRTRDEIKIKKHVMITNLDFGFWTGLFKKEPYKFLNGKHMMIFDLKNIQSNENGKPIRVNRNLISTKLTNIKKFRNRIAHNEPIIFSKQKFDAKIPLNLKNDIIFMLKLLNQNLKIYAEDIYAINTHIQKIDDYCNHMNELIKK